jgi:outer membrane protein insertion porin family
MRPVALLFLLTLLSIGSAQAEQFIIDDIQVEGLERIQPGTVFTYLPLKVGDTFDTENSPEIIHELYKTGFFQSIELDRKGRILVIKVVERPSIASINIEGNKDIKTDQLLDALKGVGIAKGRVFNRSVLVRMEIELQQQYFSQGKYNIKIDVETKDLPRNRVDINIKISEGSPAKIMKVTVVGNKAFTEKKLLKMFDSGIPAWYAFLSDRDKYSKQKLSGDLEKLRSLYLDNGYINFDILSTQVTITPDRKDLYITINIKEGEQYKVSSVKLEGEFIIKKEELKRLIQIKPGDVYSRSKITASTTDIGTKLGNFGYAFANVNVIPDIDEKNKTVGLTFFVDPGKRAYVRRINFTGNYVTSEEVLRREMRQMEAGWYSSSQVNRSKVRIQRLPYITSVNVETKRVPGSDDQVDLDVAVVERMSGSFTVGAGFSQSQGLSLNLGITEDNFKGTGKRVSTKINASKSTKDFSLSLTDPYYTLDGISRTMGFTYQSTNTDTLSISNFLLDRKSLFMGFGVPLTEYDSFNTTLNLVNNDVTTSATSAQQVIDFVNTYGNSNTVLAWNNSYIHDTRNRTIFPDSGNYQIFSFIPTLPGSDLTYYKVTYNGKVYYPVKKLVLSARASLGYAASYGSEETAVVPFYDKYYTGGYSSVRGYKDNSLGPRGSTGSAIGGDVKTVGNLEVFFPTPFLDDASNIRMSVFYDTGNVFATPEDFEVSQLRTSVGIGVAWLSPIGPLTFSYAKPLRYYPGDDLQQFQFNVGAGF